MPSRFFRYLGTGHGRLSLFLVLACALTLSYFCARTFLVPLPRSYPADFGDAQWISARVPSHGYFRKSIYVNARVVHAWLQIAATDAYEVYVNGVLLEQNRFNAACVSGIYDLKPLLREGKNVIAVHVYRFSFPGAAQLVARGSYLAAGSPSQDFRSDATWKVSNTPDGLEDGYLPTAPQPTDVNNTQWMKFPRGYSWKSPDLDDSGWSDAQPGQKDGRPEAILPLRLPPQLYQRPVPGAWIGSPDSRALDASFRTEFTVPILGQGETWIQVAATGSYDILINGKLAVTQPIVTPDLPAQPSGSMVLSDYNITSFLRSGINTLLARVHTETGPPAVLLNGMVFRGREVRPFSTDESWKSLTRAGGAEAEWTTHATVLGHYNDAPWPTYHARQTKSQLPTNDTRTAALWSLVFLGATGAVLLLWVICSQLCSAATGRRAEGLWSVDAISHFALWIFLLILLLVSYDIRISRDWCFTAPIVLGAFVFLIASKLLLLLCRPAPEVGTAVADAAPRIVRWHKWALVLGVASLMAMGGAVRLARLSDVCFDVDEMSVIELSKGVLRNGIPHAVVGSYTRWQTTYEMLGYTLAAARVLFGTDEAALRIPSLIFSTLTIGLVAIVGRRLFDWRVGLVSALIYSLHPACLYWSRNAFWPSQGQLLGLLTMWFFFEAIQTRPFRRGYLTAATAAFICFYLTWEGSGFMLPALLAALLLFHAGKYDWLKDWHLWRCVFVMAIVVLLQLLRRQIVSLPTYVAVGVSLAEISTPQIAYLNSATFDPSYYLDNFLFIENNYALTLVMLCGLPFCWRDRNLRFLVVIILVSVFCYSEGLPFYAERYTYYCQPILIVAAVAVLAKLACHVGDLAAGAASSRWPRLLARCGGGASLLALIMASNEAVLKTYKLSNSPSDADYSMRSGLYRHDFRGAAQFVKAHKQPGDAVIVQVPHVFENYAQFPADYAINTRMDRKIFYDGASGQARLIDKIKGRPSLQSLDDFLEVRARYRRVWIVFVPFGPGPSQNPEVEAYLAAHQKVVFESYKARVILLEGTQPLTEQHPVK